jgi:hypothetical protein
MILYRMFTHKINVWGCGLQIVDGLWFGLYAVPSLRFGAASIPQPFIGKSLVSFYYALDYAIEKVFINFIFYTTVPILYRNANTASLKQRNNFFSQLCLKRVKKSLMNNVYICNAEN